MHPAVPQPVVFPCFTLLHPFQTPGSTLRLARTGLVGLAPTLWSRISSLSVGIGANCCCAVVLPCCRDATYARIPVSLLEVRDRVDFPTCFWSAFYATSFVASSAFAGARGDSILLVTADAFGCQRFRGEGEYQSALSVSAHHRSLDGKGQ